MLVASEGNNRVEFTYSSQADKQKYPILKSCCLSVSRLSEQKIHDKSIFWKGLYLTDLLTRLGKKRSSLRDIWTTTVIFRALLSKQMYLLGIQRTPLS